MYGVYGFNVCIFNLYLLSAGMYAVYSILMFVYFIYIYYQRECMELMIL